VSRSIRTPDHGYWTRVQKVVIDKNGDPQVKDTTCCCAAAGGLRRVCARAAGNKTPCRCACHGKCACKIAKCGCHKRGSR